MSELTLDELREAIEEMGTAWVAFKRTNDERLAEIERKGSADPLLSDKLRRLEGDLSRLEVVARRTGFSQFNPGDRPAEWKGTGPGEAFCNFLRRGENDQRTDIKALVVNNDAAGGYLAPREYYNEILKGVTEYSPIRSLARVLTTTANEIEIPKRTGTPSAAWVSETGTRSEDTSLAYGMEQIPTNEQYVLLKSSNVMLEDSSFDMEAELQSEASEQFGKAEGTAFISGSGVGKPEGLFTNSSVSSVSSGTAATIADANGTGNGLVNLFYSVKTTYAQRGYWLLNRNTLASVRLLKDSQGRYLWQPGLAMGAPNTILGAPYAECVDAADEAADAYPIMFGDIGKAYIIVDRVRMSVLRDPYTSKTTGITEFMFRRRVGGQCVLAEAVAKLKCST